MPEEVVAPVVAPPVEPAAPALAAVVTDPNTGDQAPPPPPEETPEAKAAEETPEQAAKREGRRFGRRLDAANRRAAEERARADFLDGRLKELTQKTQPVAQDGAPRVENFTDIGEYEAASAKYHREQGIKEYAAQQRSQSNQQAQARLVSEWEQKADKGSSKYDDFDEVVGTLTPTSPMVVAIMQADNAEDVAYYLSKNMEEASRIISLDPVSQVRAVAKLEARLQAEPPKPKQPSQAPEPFKPVSGTRSNLERGSEHTSNYKDFLRARNRELGRVSK